MLGAAMTANSTSTEIALLRKQLAEVEQERLKLVHRIDELEAVQRAAAAAPPAAAPQRAVTPTVTNSSSGADKIALFRRLFGGRTDVFPVR